MIAAAWIIGFLFGMAFAVWMAHDPRNHDELPRVMTFKDVHPLGEEMARRHSKEIEEQYNRHQDWFTRN